MVWLDMSGLVRGLVWSFKPGGEAGPGIVAEKLNGGEFALGLVFAEFGVEEGIIESCAGGVGIAGTVIDDIEAGPVAGGQTHGAGLATGVEFAALEGEGVESFACGANGVDFAMRCWVVGGCNGVDAFADDAAVVDDDGCERAARAGARVFSCERNGAAQEVGIGVGSVGQLARNLPQGRK